VRKLAGMRVTAGYSQEDVAKVFNITQSAVSSWERRASNPSLDKMKQLADLYGVTMLDIFESCRGGTNTVSLREGEDLDNDDTCREHL